MIVIMIRVNMMERALIEWTGLPATVGLDSPVGYDEASRNSQPNCDT